MSEWETVSKSTNDEWETISSDWETVSPSSQQQEPSKLSGFGDSILNTGLTIPTWKPNVQQPAGNPVQAALKKAGIAYEPDKYEYRVTVDGQVQRKAKK